VHPDRRAFREENTASDLQGCGHGIPPKEWLKGVDTKIGKKPWVYPKESHVKI